MRFSKFMALVLPAAFVTANALAQADPDRVYSGTWVATIVADNGARQVSRAVIDQFAGTWYGLMAESKGSCRRPKAPITVQESNAATLAFTVWGKTEGPGCKDLTILLKPVAEGVFEGTVEGVGSIKLVKR